MSNARIFFAGMGTSVLLLGAGFGSGLMLARMATEPVIQSRATAADRLPPARVVLPASAEAPPARLAPALVETLVATGVPTPHWQERSQLALARDVQAQSQSAERDKQAERAEKKKPEAEERDRRRRYAERKARREAARAKQQQEQYEARRLQPNRMAFGGNEEQSRSETSSLGN
jgi:hypothetical protein